MSYSIKNWLTGELLHVFHYVYTKLQASGFKLQLHKSENESSAALETFITGNNTALQYMPPKMHHPNTAKWAVQIWKYHFKAGLASLPKQFCITHWCRLTTWCDITHNMWWPFQQNLKTLCTRCPPWGISLWCNIHGSIRNKMLCPCQTTVPLILRPQCHWCILCHYWCYHTIIPATGAEHISDIITFQHHMVQIPHMSTTDRIVHAARNLEQALLYYPMTNGDKMEAILEYYTHSLCHN